MLTDQDKDLIKKQAEEFAFSILTIFKEQRQNTSDMPDIKESELSFL